MPAPTPGADYNDTIRLVHLALDSGDRSGHIGVVDRKDGRDNDRLELPGSR
jgi:hypothetical protein